MTYTEQLLVIEITFLEGRDDEIKKSLLADINRNLVSAGVVRADDVFVMITEIGAGERLLRPRPCPASPRHTAGGLT